MCVEKEPYPNAMGKTQPRNHPDQPVPNSPGLLNDIEQHLDNLIARLIKTGDRHGDLQNSVFNKDVAPLDHPNIEGSKAERIIRKLEVLYSLSETLEYRIDSLIADLF